MAPARWLALATLLLLALPAQAEAPVSGTVTGEMRLGDQAIKLTHVYVMEPFILPDAPPDPEVARRLIVILADRPYPGDLPPTSLPISLFFIDSKMNGMHLELDRETGELLYASPHMVSDEFPASTFFPITSVRIEAFQRVANMVTARVVAAEPPSRVTERTTSGVIVTRGTSSAIVETDGSRAPSPMGDVILDATLIAPVLPKPVLSKVLIGHNARGSQIALAFAAALHQEREASVAEAMASYEEYERKHKRSEIDKPTLVAFRQFLFASIPEVKSMDEKVARLERIDIYGGHAILRFRPETFAQALYSVRSTSSDSASSSSSNTTSDDSAIGARLRVSPYREITITRVRVEEPESRPSGYFGESVMPIERHDLTSVVHMILDYGEWRLARK
jgi:hypothetical protein